jgi:shikimate kinase
MARDREQFYEQVASVVVDTSGLTIAEVADEILAQLKGLQ